MQDRGKGRRFHKPLDSGLVWSAWEQVLRRHLDGHDGPRRLWAAVLEDALFLIYRSRNVSQVRAALAWLAFSPEDAERDPWPGHFERICLELDLPANVIREQVATDQRAGVTRLAPPLSRRAA